MNNELKKQIFNWLIDNGDLWQTVNECMRTFKQYIYDDEGQYIIGGEEVGDFIRQANDLIRG